MAKSKRYAAPIAEIANRLLDPLLARRAGINTMLLASWSEIVGDRYGQTSRPEKIRWPRDGGESESGTGFNPGQLTVACESAVAVFMMHEERELISRINSFFGYPAIIKIRFNQKSVRLEPRRPSPRPLDRMEQKRLEKMLHDVDDGALRKALEKLGTGVMRRKKSMD